MYNMYNMMKPLFGGVGETLDTAVGSFPNIGAAVDR